MSGLDERLALVTGASRGLGYATALGLAKAGCHVIAVARTSGGLEDLDDQIQALGGTATLVPLDVRDGDGLDRLGHAIHERWQRLDILIANAGTLGPLSPLGHITPKDFDEVIATNITANWRLIRALDPLLKASPSAHAVFVTASAAGHADPFWGAYALSKAALNALAQTYAAECTGTSVTSHLFDPGPMRTALRARAMPGEEEHLLPEPSLIVPRLLGLCAITE